MHATTPYGNDKLTLKTLKSAFLSIYMHNALGYNNNMQKLKKQQINHSRPVQKQRNMFNHSQTIMHGLDAKLQCAVIENAIDSLSNSGTVKITPLPVPIHSRLDAIDRQLIRTKEKPRLPVPE